MVKKRPFDLCLITNDPKLARRAESCGVERVMVDLETQGKETRQKGQGLFTARHSLSDLSKIRSCLRKTRLLARINPPHSGTADEIDRVVEKKADILMLPMFRNARDAERFVRRVDGRAKTCLLIERREAVKNLRQIVRVGGIDEIHVGLNDLKLSLRAPNRFDCVVSGLIQKMSETVTRAGIRFGFGGVAPPGLAGMPVDPRRIIAEQVYLGSEMAIFARSISTRLERGDLPLSSFPSMVRGIRLETRRWQRAPKALFERNRRALRRELALWHDKPAV